MSEYYVLRASDGRGAGARADDYGSDLVEGRNRNCASCALPLDESACRDWRIANGTSTIPGAHFNDRVSRLEHYPNRGRC